MRFSLLDGSLRIVDQKIPRPVAAGEAVGHLPQMADRRGRFQPVQIFLGARKLPSPALRPARAFLPLLREHVGRRTGGWARVMTVAANGFYIARRVPGIPLRLDR